uniref:hypothetical protein n=1 Tax=Singerocybe alboinfundibuliformis TaxID=1346812 RepID=UPI0030FF1A58
MTRLFLNKHKIPNWFKYLILTIILLFITNTYLYILPYFTYTNLVYFWVFGLYNSIIFFTFNYIFIIIINKNKNLKLPSNLPGFILDQLKGLKVLSTKDSFYNSEKKRNKYLAIISLILFIAAFPILIVNL